MIIDTKCPYCNINNCISQVAFENVRYYGSKVFNLPCKHCGKMIRAALHRRVVCDSIRKSDKQLSDSDF